MERLSAKEYLSQYFEAKVRIQQLEEEIARLETMKEKITKATDGINVQTSGDRDKLDKIINKIDKNITTVMEERDLTLDIGHEVMTTIRKVKDVRYSSLLWERYVDFVFDPDSDDPEKRSIRLKRFEQIAMETGYTYDWVVHLHGLALLEVQKIINSTC